MIYCVLWGHVGRQTVQFAIFCKGVSFCLFVIFLMVSFVSVITVCVRHHFFLFVCWYPELFVSFVHLHSILTANVWMYTVISSMHLLEECKSMSLVFWKKIACSWLVNHVSNASKCGYQYICIIDSQMVVVTIRWGGESHPLSKLSCYSLYWQTMISDAICRFVHHWQQHPTHPFCRHIRSVLIWTLCLAITIRRLKIFEKHSNPVLS